MNSDDSEVKAAADDLNALAAAANGRVTSKPVNHQRDATIAELKAKYEAGQLSVDEKASLQNLLTRYSTRLSSTLPLPLTIYKESSIVDSQGETSRG